MRRFSALLLASSLLAGQARGEPIPETGRQLIERVVAVIEGRPLLLSELEFEARVGLIRQGGIEASRAPLSDGDRASALDYVIGQRLAHAEADRLQVFDVEDAEVALAVQAFAQRFPSASDFRLFLQRYEVSEEQLAAILRRDLRVARFLEGKIKRAARVSEDDLRRYYAERPEDFAGAAYPQVREAIRARLLRERYRLLAQKQLEELRARAEVRLLVRFVPDRPAAPLSGPVPAAQQAPLAAAPGPLADPGRAPLAAPSDDSAPAQP